MTNSNDNQKRGGNFVTVGEYLQIVIQFQLESAQFYHDLKGQTDRRDAVELLDILEKQEIHHQRILRAYKVKADPNSILQFLQAVNILFCFLTGLAVFEREHEERLKSLQRYY